MPTLTRLRTVVVATLTAILSCPGTQASGQNPEPIPLELKNGLAQARGKITKDDPVETRTGFPYLKGAPYKVYAVKLQAGQMYRLDMVSADVKTLDPFLRLETASGKVLAADDDSGENLNARIIFRSKEDGTYHLIATSFARQTGTFTIVVRHLAFLNQKRIIWIYHGGYFKKIDEQRWMETNPDGTWYFQEQARNADFIELHD